MGPKLWTKDGAVRLQVKDTAAGALLSCDDETGVFEALVSVTGVVDEQGDVIEPGAYAHTLTDLIPKGIRFHDWTRPAAKTLEAQEWPPGDSRLPATTGSGATWPKEAGALYIKGQYNLATQTGREAYEDAKFFGSQGQWSIGYWVPPGGAVAPKDSKADKQNKIRRRIKRLSLYEYSDVLHGANRLTTTLTVKDAGMFEDGSVDEPLPGVLDQKEAGDTDGGPPADWLERIILAADGDSGGEGKAGEQTRRAAVVAAFTTERDAERKRRVDADTTINDAPAEQRARLRATETSRRAKWSTWYAGQQEKERARRREWAAAQSTKTISYPDLDDPIALDIDDDPLQAGETDGGQEEPDEDEEPGEQGNDETAVKGTPRVETKMMDSLPGSYEERREAVCEAVRASMRGTPNADGEYPYWVYVIGTWADRAVVCRSGQGVRDYWQVPYTVDDTGVITLGEAQQVQLRLQATPVTKSGEPDHAQAAVQAATALVGDALTTLELAQGVKAGRVLSGVNATRLRAAVDAMAAVLAAAGITTTDDDGDDEGEGEVGGESVEDAGEKTSDGVQWDAAALLADLDGLRV